MTRIVESLDDGRISFGDREGLELATAVDRVCCRTLRRADAASAVDYGGAVYFFCSLACRAQFEAELVRYVRAQADIDLKP